MDSYGRQEATVTISNNSTGLRPGVCLSTNRPTAPYEGHIIYETDTDLVYLWNGSSWIEVISALTKAPRGIMGNVATSTTNQTGITTIIAATGLSITFTALSNRRYRFTWHEPNLDSNGNVQCIFYGRIQLTNISGTALAESRLSFAGPATSNNHFFHLEAIYTPTSSGSITLICSGQASNSTSFLRSTVQPSFFIVEDIGGV